MPEIALIPPYSLISTIRKRKLQMLLPACLQSTRRRNFHRDAFPEDAYVILDNGLFEDDSAVHMDSLLRLAAEFQVNEIVLPDVRGDGPETVNATAQGLQVHEKDCLGCDIVFMAVIQGSSQAVRRDTIKALADIVPPGTVFGFPRRLTQEHIHNRLELMDYTVDNYGARFPLHMLGLSREWPAELLRAARQFGSHLRGLDTSAPYTYAFGKKTIGEGWDPSSERSKHYFVEPPHKFLEHIVAYNTHVLDSWARSITPATFDVWYNEVPTRQKRLQEPKNPQGS